jgi:hypothetical protein
MSAPGMTRLEREDLRRLARYQATLAKTGAAQRAAELRADFEEQLASIFRFDDDAIWKAATEAANAAVDEADYRIAAGCNELGIPERFRPSLHLNWYNRGENASAKRRAELRKVAESRIEAAEKKARYDIDNWCVKTQAALIKDSLTSVQAVAFLEQMPTAEQLMPTLDARRIASLLPGGNFLIERPGDDDE